MAKIVCSIALLMLILTSAAFAQEEKVEINKTTPFEKNIRGGGPTTFVIENSLGNVNVYEVTGDALEVSAHYQGDDKAYFVFDQPEAGKLKMSIRGTDSKDGGSVFQNNFGGINMSGDNNSFISSVYGSVQINGVTMNLSGNSVHVVGNSGRVILKVGIPASHLVHLKVESTSGDISVDGAFANSLLENRQVWLETGSGDINCGAICAQGAVKVETGSGDIHLTAVNGSVKAQTGSGGIKAVNNRGSLKVSTGSGLISVVGQTGGNVDASTGAGSISFDNPDPSVTERASTGAGAIRGKKPSKGEKVVCPKVLKELFEF